MKIEDKNKRKAYNNYLARSGAGLASKYTPRRQLPASAVSQMKHKPYGGINHEQGKHGYACDQVTGSNEAVAGTD